MPASAGSPPRRRFPASSASSSRGRPPTRDRPVPAGAWRSSGWAPKGASRTSSGSTTAGAPAFGAMRAHGSGSPGQCSPSTSTPRPGCDGTEHDRSRPAGPPAIGRVPHRLGPRHVGGGGAGAGCSNRRSTGAPSMCWKTAARSVASSAPCGRNKSNAPSRFQRTKSWMVWKMARSDVIFLSAIC